MAQNQTNFGVGFQVDKSGLNDLKKSLQDIIKIGQQKSSTGGMTKELEQACKAAKQLEGILDGAWNNKLGQLNLDKVNQGIQTTFKSVGQLKNALDASGGVGTAAYNKMASQILSTNLQLKQTNKLLDDMATSMANTVKWGITSSIFNNMTRSVQDAFYYVKGLNSSLTDIRIVTGASTDQMAAFAEKANAAAKALGQTTRNYTDASLIYYQQGLSEADVEARTQTTLKAANVTGQSTDEVSELLTSVWNGYKVSAAEAELYIDKIAAVATTTASDLEELSVGMSKVASAASLMGVDIDQLNAQLATIVSVTRQAPESVGTALKTIYARMGDIEAGLDGETTLGTYTEKMKEMGFNVLDAQGKLRDMGGVIEEIGGKWSSMTREQQLSLAQTVAGTRQYNNLLALFDNWDMYTNALNTSSQAMGTLQEQNDIYMQSTEAHLKQLKAEAEETYSALLKAEDINAIVDVFSGALDQLNDFINGLGGGVNALVNFGSVAARVFDKQIANSILRMQQNLEVAKINKAADDMKTQILAEETKKQNQKSNTGIDAESKGFQAQVEAAKEVHAIRNSLTQEQYQETLEIQKQIGLETNKLETLKQQKMAVEDFTEESKVYQDITSRTDDEIQDQIDKEKEKNKELENSIQALQKIRDLMEEVERLSTKDVEEAERKAQEVQELAEKYESEVRDGLFAGGLNSDQREEVVENMKNFKAGDTAFKEVANINKSIEESKKQQQEHTAVIEAGTSALRKRHTSFDQEIKDTKKIIDNLKTQNKEYVNIGNKVSKIIKDVQKWATIGQILTSISGGLSTLFDKTSTGADKLNAGFQILVNTASALGPKGMVVAGLLSIVKVGLEATGVWEKFADKLKSTEKKLEEINNATQEINNITQQSKAQISSLKAIEEEYAELSALAGKYGENLDAMTEEEQARYHELTSAFTQYNDEVILGYDAQGNAIVNNQNALQKTIELIKTQAKETARTQLGDVSSLIATKDKDITDKQAGVDAAQTASEAYVEEAKVEQSKFLDKTIEYIDGALQDSDKAQELRKSLESLSSNLTNVSSFEEMEAQAAELYQILNEIETISKEVHGLKDDFNIIDNLDLSEDYFNQISTARETYEGALKEAESLLAEAQAFDTSTIMRVLQFGLGYDQEWEGLSDQAQDVGYNLLLQYLEGIQYGTEEGQADSYDKIIAMGQQYILSLQEAIDVGYSNISKAGDKFKKSDAITKTIKEQEELIAQEVLNEIANIPNFAELSSEVQEIIEQMFEDAFDINLELNTDGSIASLESTASEYVDTAYATIQKAVSKQHIQSSQIDIGAVDLDSILNPEQIKNIDEIIQNIDWSRMRVEGQSLSEALKLAAQESESVISTLREQSKLGVETLDKLNNKGELTAEELSYLDALEQENAELASLARGSKAYSDALLEIQKNKKAAMKTALDDEITKTIGKIQTEKDDSEHMRNMQKEILRHGGSEDSDAYKSLQTDIEVNDSEIIALEEYLRNLEYEILCLAVVEADPSIKDQIDALYNESDTLLTIRATLEDDQALSDEQTSALGDFFASEEGQPFLDEYLRTGAFTEELLSAVEAFAQGKTDLAENLRAEIQADAQTLAAEADRLEAQAQAALDRGDDAMAADYQIQADTKRTEAAKMAAEEVQYESGDVEREEKSFDQEMTDLGLDADEVEDLADSIQDLAKESDDLADSLEDDADAAKELAKEIKRYDNALESVEKNSKKWNKALKSGNVEEQAEAIQEMDKAYSDLLDLDYGTLSDEFLTNADNLALLEEAANGSEEAYNALAEQVQQDILIQCGVNDEEAWNQINALENKVLEGIDDIEIGANIDNTDAILAMNELINQAGMTAEQATAYLASMGVDAEVESVEVPEEDKKSFISAQPAISYVPASVPKILPDGNTDTVTVHVPKIYYAPQTQTETAQGSKTATALRVKSAKKSSGGGFKFNNSKAGGAKGGGGGGKKGGGGGGGGGGSAAKTVGPRKKDYYHNVNNSLKKLGTAYDKLAEVQEKTFGKKHIDNLTKINKNLDNQINKMRERIKIANEQEKVDLKKDITSQYSDVKFNNDGTIANYEEVLAKYYAAYSNTGQSKEAQDAAKEKYDKLKELLDEYETLILETIPGWEAEIREKINEKYENMTAQFEYEITMRTDWGESIREYKEFKHEFGDFTEDLIAQSTLAYNTSKSFFDSKELTSKTRQLNDALGELEKINSALKQGKDISKKGDEEYFSDIWGDNKQKLMDYIATLQTDLMDNLLAISNARNEAYDNYLEAIDEGISKMNEHLDQYNQLTEELDHNRNLIELIYGEESDKIGDIYKAQHKVNVESLKGHQLALANYQKQAELRRQQLEEEAKNNHTRSVTGAVQTTDRYKEIEEELKYYEEAIEETEATIRDTTTSSIENIIALYEYNVSQMFKNLNKENLGFGLSEAQTQWDLLNKEAEQYLDTMNTTFEVQKLESKFVDALNKTDNLKSQERIKTVMDEQLRILEEKDKVSQYDVDRANLIYDLTLKQIALEEAQQNKSKMRLRRDAQGNYSYQFSADADLIKQTQQELLDVQQQLYNLDKNEYKNQLDIMAGYYEEWQNKLQEVALIKDAEERDRTAAMVNDYYTRLIENAANQSQVAEENLENLLNGPLADFKAGNEEIADEIKTMYDSAFATMADNFAQEGGVADTIKKAWEEISDAAEDYLEQLEQIAKVSKDSFGNLENPSKIVEGVEQITAATKDLNKAWNATLKSLKSLFTKIDDFLNSPEMQAAIEALTKSESKEKSEKKKAGDAAEKANKEAVAEPVKKKEEPKKEPAKPAEKPKEEPKKKEVKVGGQINAKGAYIYTYINKGRDTQLFASDPNYTVLKMQDGWVQVRHHKARPGVVDGWFKQSDVTALKSGGYTGNWNSEEGRLAFLHQKELVLNQRDTRNILDAVNIIRGLSGLLQNSMINRIEGLTQSLNNIAIPAVQPNVETQPQSIEQTVHITAEFPGATEAIQIETALNSLVNRASQYANRKE